MTRESLIFDSSTVKIKSILDNNLFVIIKEHADFVYWFILSVNLFKTKLNIDLTTDSIFRFLLSSSKYRKYIIKYIIRPKIWVVIGVVMTVTNYISFSIKTKSFFQFENWLSPISKRMTWYALDHFLDTLIASKL